MVELEAECIWALGAELGEAPLWMAEQNRLYLVDLKGRRLHALDLDLDPAPAAAAAGSAGARHSWTLPEYMCWLIPRRDGDGFMAGLRDGIAHLWLEPELRLEYVARPFDAAAGVRLNDAKADASGHIWAGSMHNGDYHRTDGQLIRLDHDFSWQVQAGGYHICNGPAFNREGTTLYHTDSYLGRVYAYPIDVRGDLGEPALWRQFDQAAEGGPDGMTVDSEGCLWIAQWGGARVCRYSEGGELLATVRLPVRNPASCTLGGADLKTLYITTAREGNSVEQLAAAPLSGGLFAVRVEVAGVPVARFGASAP